MLNFILLQDAAAAAGRVLAALQDTIGKGGDGSRSSGVASLVGEDLPVPEDVGPLPFPGSDVVEKRHQDLLVPGHSRINGCM